MVDILAKMQSKFTGAKKTINFIKSSEQQVRNRPQSAAAVSSQTLVGLENLGNTCFMNSVLQLLTHQKDFKAAITEAIKHKCSKKFCTLCSTQRLLERQQKATSSFAPKELASNMRHISKHLKLGRQEDSHEFMRYLIEKLNDAIKPSKAIEAVFGGSLASQVTCTQCKTISTVFDPTMDLSLDIKNCNSVEQALYRFAAPELLNKSNQYKCEKCKKLVDAHKRMGIGKEPQVLVIQLKRFNSFFRNASKVTRTVKFSEILDINPFLAESSREEKKMSHVPPYTLVGVLVHSGHSCNSGHYYSFVKPSKGSAWYRMNDDEVSIVGVDHVLSQSAYILLYEKQEASLSSKNVNSVVSNPLPLKSLPKKDPYAYKNVPLNSTFGWTVENASSITAPNPLLNATVAFQVTKIPTHQFTSNNENKGSASVQVGEIDRYVTTVPTAEVTKETATRGDPSKSFEPASLNANVNLVQNIKGESVYRQNHPHSKPSFLEELQNQSPVVSTWNHVATSDAVFERRLYLDDIQRAEKLKRKRASKEDMEYDAPKRSKKFIYQ